MAPSTWRNWRKAAGLLSLLAIPPILAGCALPASAPTSVALESQPLEPTFNYFLVKMDARVSSVLHQFRPGFGPFFKLRRYVASNILRPGDRIAITVYESGGSALFPPPTSFPGATITTQPGQVTPGASTVPPQTIEADGTVTMPYAGNVRLAGRTPAEAARLIEKALEGKAVNPQVVVTLAVNNSNAATVSGEVNAPTTVPLTLRGERLLDAIGIAGGPKYPPWETYVRVVRENRVESVLLQTIIEDPRENIVVRPNDQIFVTRYPRSFAVLGATNKVAQYPFETEKVTLAEAIARAGGPIDAVGDPAGIYLFRLEPWSVAKKVLPPSTVEGFAGAPPEFVPILYRTDLREAQGYFLAQSVQMRDKDVVLVTNAMGTQLQKLLVLVGGAVGIANDVKGF